jgi:tRNA(fMet)-specific endonuclease VapC
VNARYLLDTNILNALSRNPKGSIYSRIRDLGADSVCTSIIVACEIRFGLEKNSSSALRDRLEKILSAMEVLSLDPPVEEHYAEIRWHLENNGISIGPNDLLIAAQARGLGLTIVTDNVKEFRRVPELSVENWIEWTLTASEGSGTPEGAG